MVARIVLGSFEGYRRTWVRPDVLAGLTVWAVLVPESLAYATIAGVPPVVGLYAAVPRSSCTPCSAARGTSSSVPCRPPPPCRPAWSPTFAARRRRLRGPHRRARARHRRWSRWSAGLLRLGFLADVHLRAGAQGLHHRPGADDHGRPAPQAVRGRRRASGNFFEKLWDLVTRPGRHRRAHARRRRCVSLAVMLGCGAGSPLVPASLVVVLARRRWPSTLFDLDDHGRRPRRPHRRRACRRSGSPTSRLSDYLDLVGRGRRRDARRLRRGARRGQDLRRQGTATTSTPTASCSGSARPTSAPGCAAGMVVNGSLSKTAVNGGAGARVAAVRA